MTSIFIPIACHDRQSVAALCLPTIRDCAHPDDVIALYDDGSTEYDHTWLEQFLPDGHSSIPLRSGAAAVGIQAQRRMHLSAFLALGHLTHCYLTDHDCIHDPFWREYALWLQAKYNLPVCLYDTEAHSRLVGNTIEDNPTSEVIIRHAAPGVSYLLTRAHIEKLASFIPQMQHFDWEIPAILGSRFAVSRIGYVDHIGWGGDRHPVNDGPDGGDRVKRPTEWLVKKRAEIVATLA